MITHPVKFNIGGMLFEVVTSGPVTQAQAAKIAMLFYQQHRHTFKRAQRGKLIQVITHYDRDSAALL